MKSLAVIWAPEYNVGGKSQGKIYIFRSGSTPGDDWAEEQIITLSSPVNNDLFGRAVDIYGTTVISGAPGRDEGGTDRGAAFIYNSSSTGWALTQTLSGSDSANSDQFGQAVSIHGTTAAISTNNKNKVYIFELENGSWNQKQIIQPDRYDSAASKGFGKNFKVVQQYFNYRWPRRSWIQPTLRIYTLALLRVVSGTYVISLSKTL